MLGAKTLILLTFVNLPMLLADILILRVYGFSVFSETPGLLWSHLLIVMAVVLPMAALAAVTAGLAQMLFQTLTLALVLIISSTGRIGYAWQGLNWIRSSLSLLVAAAAALTVVLWQYSARKTFKSRILFASAFVAALLMNWLVPWTSTFEFQSCLSRHSHEASSVQVSFDVSKKWLAPSMDIEKD